MSYTGQLLNSEGQPSVGQQVEALVCVEGTENGQGLFLKHFDAERITAKTDSDGKYVLPDIPTEMNVILLARNQQDSSESDYLDIVYLEAHEDRPLAIHRIGTTKPSADKYSLAERIEKNAARLSFGGLSHDGHNFQSRRAIQGLHRPLLQRLPRKSRGLELYANRTH
ncbi:MAG: hypothetical protein R3C56_32785 [Pirellulaceae bacterium]